MDWRYVQLVEVNSCHNQNVAAHKGLYAYFCRLIISCVTVMCQQAEGCHGNLHSDRAMKARYAEAICKCHHVYTSIPALIYDILFPFSLHCFVFEGFYVARLALNLLLHGWPDLLLLHSVKVTVVIKD